MAELLENYDFGILSYENDSYNNYYSAPLKIYEYVNLGLRVVSLLPNIGIESVQHLYPELFVDTHLKSFCSNYSAERYQRARLRFLQNALETNRSFAALVSRHHLG